MPKGCFCPVPAVDSAVIRLDRRPSPPFDCDGDLFVRVVRAAFNYQRKTLSNGLAASFPALGKSGAAEVIAGCGLEPNVRCGQMSPADFAAVTAAIAGRTGQHG